MLLMRRNAIAWMIAVLSLLAPATSHACPKCHSGPDGSCGADCTCCGDAHASAPQSPSFDPPAAEPGVVDVLMLDYQFVPENITVTPGTTVRWINEDADAHDTISDDALWHSEYLGSGDTFEYTF